MEKIVYAYNRCNKKTNSSNSDDFSLRFVLNVEQKTLLEQKDAESVMEVKCV